MGKYPRVRLRGANEDDLPTLLRWYSDEELMKWSLGRLPLPPTMEELRGLYMTVKSHRRFMVAEDMQEGMAIGMASIFAIDYMNGNCRVGLTIGERGQWGRGYGREMLTLLYRLAFESLNMHRVFAECLVGNQRVLQLVGTLGTRTVGTLRKATFVHGRWHDLVALSTSASDFRRATGTGKGSN